MEERPTFQDQPATLPGMESYAVDAPQDRASSPSRRVAPGNKVSISAMAHDIEDVKNRGGYFAKLDEGDRGDARRETELAAFGIPEDTPASERPVYGFLRPEDNPSAHGSYGDINLNIAESALDGATTTPGDSVWRLRTGKDINSEDLNETHTPGFVPGKIVPGQTLTDSASVGYREVQIPKGVQWKDIESADVVTPYTEDSENPVRMSPEADRIKEAQREAKANTLRRLGLNTTHSTREYRPSLFENLPVRPEWDFSIDPDKPINADVLSDVATSRGEWIQGKTLSSGSTPTTASAEEDFNNIQALKKAFVDKYGTEHITDMPSSGQVTS